MTAGGALVDAGRKRAHAGDALGNLLAEQHAAAAGFRALADDDLDRVGAAQVVRIHAVARRQDLIDEDVGMLPLLLGHAAVAGCRRGSKLRGAAAERLLGRPGQGAEAHAGDGHRNLEMDRLQGVAGAEPDVGAAFLAIAFERIAADRGAEEQEIVEIRHLALGAEAADIVDAGRRGPADFRKRVFVEGRGWPRGGRRCRLHQ